MSNSIKKLGSNNIFKIIFVFLLCFIPNMIEDIISYIVQVVLLVVMTVNQAVGADELNTEDITELFNSHLMEIQSLILIAALPVMLIMWWVLIKYIKKKNKYAKYRPKNALTYLWLLPLAYVTMMFGNLLTSLIEECLPQSMIDVYNSTNDSLHTGSDTAIILSAVILAPIIEEIIYRGIVYDFVAFLENEVYAVIISAAVFGIIHQNVVQGIYAFTIGLVFGYVRFKYGNIFTTIFMHMLANGIATAVYYSSATNEPETAEYIEDYTSVLVEYTFGYGFVLFILLFCVSKFVNRKQVR